MEGFAARSGVPLAAWVFISMQNRKSGARVIEIDGTLRTLV